MQFITSGPDIPDALLQAHEEGRVVFFCGAGISYPAGLPGFKKLVDEIYKCLNETFSDTEEKAYDDNQFDTTLDLLERRIPGPRVAVRKALAQILLKPKLRRKGSTDTHTSLLQLARDHEGSLRLVTTNFDRIFEHVIKRSKQPCRTYSAPFLPIPKNSRWNGLVYLHGLLPIDPNDSSALHQLILTSGDFGRAYLTERWAARFVSELFRNYVVCFIGYSINDPVLRYMMDALAADRMLGETTPPAYALGDCEPGKKQDKTTEWETKGVTPILYEVPADSPDHSALHQTLKKWAETYRDGVLGKESIVVEYALARPSASTRQDDFVGRMLWALSDRSGLPAKRFADHDPAPPFDWLDAFSEDRFSCDDLSRFGVHPDARIDTKLQFSLVSRPAPYNHAPRMALVSGRRGSGWDEVMSQIARWLTRHLDDPKLIHWLSERSGQLHENWSRLIEKKLDELADLERDGKSDELDEIRANSPNAIPGPMMRRLWRLLLTGRVKSRSPWSADLHGWKGRLLRDGPSTLLRLELRKLLAPMIVLEKPFRWGNEDTRPESPERLRQFVDWELLLATEEVRSTLCDLSDEERWKKALPALLDDFQQLLRDALDLLHEMVEDRSDRSHWYLPSIHHPHWQNRGHCDWVMLVELLRDAWLVISGVDSARATRIAQGWFDLPYPTFKRLAFFAASQGGYIAPEQWVDWLLANDARWLWSEDLRREVARLLFLQGKYLFSTDAQQRLEAAILQGPPHDKSRSELESKHWQYHQDHSIWLRLAKLDQSGLTLGEMARQRLDALFKANSDWCFDLHEREEFSHWMSATGDPDYKENRHTAPRKRRELVQWLRQPPPERHPFHEDTWRDTCRTRFFHTIAALYDLAQEKTWPVTRWHEALQTWSEKDLVRRSWHWAAPLVQTMPDDSLQEIVHGVTWWLEAVSESIEEHEDILLDMCRRVLDLPLDPDSGITQNGKPIQQPVTEAINHPVGHVTQALLNLCFKREPNDNDHLSPEIEPFFTRLCDTRTDQFRHGRVLLASRLIALFRVDRNWTEQHLLPLFRWEDSPVEAGAAWQGFLWSPRLYQPLLIAFKPNFLETARHYAALGEHGPQFARFLTYAALESVEGYTPQEFQSAIKTLPPEGLQEVARVLPWALEGAGEQREDYWRHRIQPFWKRIWPQSRERIFDGIAEPLARVIIAAGKEFPSALKAIHDWLQPIKYSHYVIHQLCESNACRQFPEAALQLLSAVIDDQQRVSKQLVGDCLDKIKDMEPELAQDHRYQQLRAHWEMRGV